MGRRTDWLARARRKLKNSIPKANKASGFFVERLTSCQRSRQLLISELVYVCDKPPEEITAWVDELIGLPAPDES
ncbi:MAG: hypothetical protein IKN16_03820 [Selenomonadaceae bacterium]|nr:hypothetical protein [Selenomonadaceae bacterium]